MRLLTAIALTATLSLAQRNENARAQLDEAKEAYKSAIAQTHDFECIAPAFDEVLQKLDAVPWGTPSKKEAKGLAKVIREKRAAALAHAQEVGRSVGKGGSAPPARGASEQAAPEEGKRRWPKVAALKLPRKGGSGSAAAAGQECKRYEKRIGQLRKRRRKEGKPDLGEVMMLPNGEAGYRPGSEPTAEEKDLLRKLRVCAGKDADDLE